MNRRKGWAKVPHGWEGLKGSKSMSEREAWLWMCAWAQNYSDNENLLEPPTLEYLTTSFGWSHHTKTTRFLDKLEALKMVCVKRAGSVLTIFIVISHLDVETCEKRAEKVHDNKTNIKTKKDIGAKSAKAGPIPRPFVPKPETVKKLKEMGATAEKLRAETPAFRDYWEAIADLPSRGHKVNWEQTYINWIKKGLSWKS